jgi:hypothetical protein
MNLRAIVTAFEDTVEKLGVCAFGTIKILMIPKGFSEHQGGYSPLSFGTVPQTQFQVPIQKIWDCSGTRV